MTLTEVEPMSNIWIAAFDASISAGSCSRRLAGPAIQMAAVYQPRRGHRDKFDDSTSQCNGPIRHD
uniref:Uncharacterized protein n=1 Tax=Kwoniella bestiolae CBS 10118 TaxID=1296100 RepID=A0A1B9GBW3_9TREE|nr:hypothetical protein I302_03344 [Kwoniella bestiolae CBS 10118]OCF28485.1 hypothetical protein I302_03344 [Kwoniella bestiolae CBS 10118]